MPFSWSTVPRAVLMQKRFMVNRQGATKGLDGPSPSQQGSGEWQSLPSRCMGRAAAAWETSLEFSSSDPRASGSPCRLRMLRERVGVLCALRLCIARAQGYRSHGRSTQPLTPCPGCTLGKPAVSVAGSAENSLLTSWTDLDPRDTARESGWDFRGQRLTFGRDGFCLLADVAPGGVGPVDVDSGDQQWRSQSDGPSRKLWKEASWLCASCQCCP